MRISDNALNVLTAKTYQGIGRAWIVRYLSGNETVNTIVALMNKKAKEDSLITPGDFNRVRERIENCIDKLAGFSDGVVALGDPDFPSYRGSVKNSDRPVVLFYRGELKLLKKSNQNIAVIGLINPDKNTEIIEIDVVSKLVSNGATIVSGLALGCDTVAHRQALRCNGKTVAILPSPLNEIVPASNKGLTDEIVMNRGLIITEYYEKAKSKMELIGRYQERDRLQALFSDCVVLTASYAKNDLGNDSGSRLAMEYASTYSIPRSVIYEPASDAENPKYDLNRQLIREQGGIIVINGGNTDSAVRSIMSNSPYQQNETIRQTDLFG
jgi:DNA processing protein